VSDWRTVTFYAAEDRKRIINDRGEPILFVSGQMWRALAGFVLSLNRTPKYTVSGPSGETLFAFQYKASNFRSWLKVLDIDGSLIARIDRIGSRFHFKSRYTVRDAAGAEIGRIDNPKLGVEFVIHARDDVVMATGVLRGQSTWVVERKNVPDMPWPEITAAFFLSITWMKRSPS
jgi:hypothetical protein